MSLLSLGTGGPGEVKLSDRSSCSTCYSEVISQYMRI